MAHNGPKIIKNTIRIVVKRCHMLSPQNLSDQSTAKVYSILAKVYTNKVPDTQKLLNGK